MQPASSCYIFGRFRLDRAERRLHFDSEVIPLTPKAFETLHVLVSHAACAVSKDELMRAVWPDGHVEEVNLAYNISIVRRALAERQPSEAFIETIPKLGYRFVAPVRPEETPALTHPLRTNLPAPLTRFIGREREIADVCHSLAAHRLVTLTGAGGVGKSRLALEVARSIVLQHAKHANDPAPLCRDGVWWVELAALVDPALVAQTVAATMGLIEGSGRQELDILTDVLRTKQALIILDNGEHLIDACAGLAEGLLRACPALYVLATSREPLGVAGEAVYRVPSLSFPDPQRLAPVEGLIAFDAVRLFADRAALAASDFDVTPHNSAAVVEVCRRLDGIPLAIELAAARVSMMSVEQIAGRLDDCFDLLTSGSRTALPRHQTLRAAIAWSFDLLTREERDLLARLAVFAGGFTAEAADAVSDRPATFDVLTKLVDKSLVVADIRGKAARYRLLETVRRFAQEHLSQSGAADSVRDLHLDYFLQLAERAEPELHRANQVTWLNRLESELDNFRASLDWSLKNERHTWAGLRIVAALLCFWHLRDHRREGRDWLESALSSDVRAHGMSAVSNSHALARAHTHNAIAFLAALDGDVARLTDMAEEALAMSRDLGELGTRAAASALLHLAVAAMMQQQHERTKPLAERSLTLFRENGDRFGMSECYSVLGQAALSSGDFLQAQHLYRVNMTVCQETGAKDGYGNVLRLLGDVAFLRGELDEAHALYEQVLTLESELGTKVWAAVTLRRLCDVAMARADYEQAVGYAKRSLSLVEDIGDKHGVGSTYLQFARIDCARGVYVQSAQNAEHALVLFRAIGDRGAIANVDCLLGTVALAQGQHKQASQSFEGALTVGRQLSTNLLIAAGLFGLGRVAQSGGYHDAAGILFKEALALQLNSRDRIAVIFTLDATACSLACMGRIQHAACLFGATQDLYSRYRAIQSPLERELHERGVAVVRTVLSEADFVGAWITGATMTIDQAVEYAFTRE